MQLGHFHLLVFAGSEELSVLAFLLPVYTQTLTDEEISPAQAGQVCYVGRKQLQTSTFTMYI